MKQEIIFRPTAIAILALFSFLFLQSCSKSSGGGSTSSASSYPFTATVNGNAFSANFVNPSLGGPGVAEITTSNGLTVVIAVGIQIVNGNDSSIFVVAFPTNIALNQPVSLTPTLNNGAAYSVEASPGSSTYNTYGTNPAYGGSGTLTVTEFDQTTNIVAGTFSGTFGSSTGTTVTITNGSFRCIITTVSNPFPSNVKV